MEYEFKLLAEIPEEIIEKPKTPSQLQREADQAEQTLNRAKQVYKTYQEESKKTSALRAEILKGVQAEEDIYQLFLKACLAVSIMAHNDLFYRQIAEDIEKNYKLTKRRT